MKDIYFTVTEIAKALRCNPESVRRWTRESQTGPVLRAGQFGRELRIKEKHLEEFYREKGWVYKDSVFPELAENKRAGIEDNNQLAEITAIVAASFASMFGDHIERLNRELGECKTEIAVLKKILEEQKNN